MHSLTRKDAIIWARSALANAEFDSDGRPYYTCDFYQGSVNGVRGRSCFHKASRHVGLVNSSEQHYGRYYFDFDESQVNRALANELMSGLRKQREIEETHRKNRENTSLSDIEEEMMTEGTVEENSAKPLFDEAEPTKTHFATRERIFAHATMKVDKPDTSKAPSLVSEELKQHNNNISMSPETIQQIEEELNASTLPDRVVAKNNHVDIDAIVKEEIAKIEAQKKMKRKKTFTNISIGLALSLIGILIGKFL